MILRVFCVSKRALFVTTTFIAVIKNLHYKPKTSLNNSTFCLAFDGFTLRYAVT